jgi:ligand-binding sensor domain-containing protein
MSFKVYIAFIFLVFTHQRLSAQNHLYKFSHLDITNGLSDNHVNCIFKDEKGFMWFGTASGLSRYDGFKFKNFKHEANNPASISESFVSRICEGPDKKLWIFTHSDISIYDPATENFATNVAGELRRYKIITSDVILIKKDNEGSFWFITKNKGVYRYNPADASTSFYCTSSFSKTILHSDAVMDLAAVKSNTVWLVYSDGIMELLDTRLNKIIKHVDGLARANLYKPESYTLSVDNMSNLWIYSAAGPIGTYCFNTQNHSLLHFSKDTPDGRLNSNIVNSVIQADDNKMWIGTDHGGVNVLDPVTHKVTYLVNKEDDPQSISGNSVLLYKDDAGIVWAGTFKQGISYYHSAIIQFPVYRHLLTDISSLPYEDINAFAEDKDGNLWIGTNGGGLINFNLQTKKYTQYKHNAANVNSLSIDIVISLYADHENKLWIGTYFGGLDCFDGQKFTHYRHNDKDKTTITDDRVYTMIEDSSSGIYGQEHLPAG